MQPADRYAALFLTRLTYPPMFYVTFHRRKGPDTRNICVDSLYLCRHGKVGYTTSENVQGFATKESAKAASKAAMPTLGNLAPHFTTCVRTVKAKYVACTPAAAMERTLLP